MRIACPRLLLALLVAALIAGACADDPAAEELLGDLVEDPTGDDDAPDGTAGDGEDDGTPITRPEQDPTTQDPDFPFELDDTPLPVDGAYRVGTLDNGLTYLLRSNDSPGGSLDLRLVVRAGSLHQETPDDGSAHFLEHMLFNGTEAYPGNELTTQLQRLGIRFGADVNAYTSYDETVYMLEANTSDPSATALAFDVLAEWASRATIDPGQVDAEIGVIRDELRQGRETVDGFVFTRLEEIYTEDTPYENRIVIGDADLVEATEATTLRAFYETWYRPDNMAVVAVGDLPLDELEDAVIERFSSLDTPAAALAVPSNLSPLDPIPVTDVIVHPDNGVDNLSLDIPLPVWDIGTVGGERMAFIEFAVARMIETRLAEAFQQGTIDLDEPAVFGSFALNRGLRYYGTNLRAPELDTALADVMAQLLLAAQEGFSDDDVERVTQQLLNGLDDELEAIESTQDRWYADELTEHFLGGGSADDAANRIARQREIVESFTADELTAFWRWVLDVSGPIVVAIGDDAGTIPDATRLREVLDTASAATGGTSAATIDELMPAPDPAAVVDEAVRSTRNGPVEIRTYDNGVVVSHQRTLITEGSFSVQLESTGGWSALDEPDASMAETAVYAVMESGAGPHDAATLQRYLESRSVGMEASIDEASERMSGTATNGDAEDLFALLHLTMVEPRVDDVALRSAQRRAEAFLDLAQTDPDLRAYDLANVLVNGNDPRFSGLPTPEEIEELEADALLDIFTTRFSSVDDLHVAIVGDIGADEAFDLAARYLGTLPERSAPDTWTDLGVALPTTAVTEEVVLGAGTANGGLQRIDWTLGQPQARDEVAAVVLSTVVTTRLRDVIREELGASYGSFATIVADREGPGGMVSVIDIGGDPARLDEIETALDTILTGLATDGPTQDEFDRAVTLTRSDYEYVDNGLFLSANIAATRFPDLDTLGVDERFRLLDGIERDDLSALAAALYADPASVQITKVLPQE
jgi:zinc protease